MRISFAAPLLMISTACASATNGTRRDEIADDLHGVRVADPYRWLEKAADPEVQAWMHAQNDEATRYLRALPHRKDLDERLNELHYVESVSVPIKRGGRRFYERQAADQEKGVVYVDGRVLIDANKLSADGSISLGVWVPSWDGKKLAYTLKPNNADEATLHVLDVDTAKTSEVDVVGGARYTEPSWAPDGSGFYYTWSPTDPAIPAADRMGFAEVRFHALGTQQSEDKVIREKLGDPTRFLSAQITRDGRHLFLTIWHGWAECEVYVRPAGAAGWTPFAVGKPALYRVTDWNGTFYVSTNEGAPRWRVFAVQADKQERESWREIVAEDKDAVLDSVQVVGGHLALSYTRNATSEIAIHTLDGAHVRKVTLPAIGSASGLYGEPDDDEAFFEFSSFTHPREIHRTSIATGQTEVHARVNLPIDAGKFAVEQVWYPSKDGTRISMFIVGAKGLAKTGDQPTLLYGYGGFNISLTPYFSPAMYAWIERGGVFAVPNLRGGGEYGEAWHEAGMLAKKQNVFDDFIAAAEWLIAQKYTRRERLSIYGRSNGGLLVGAAMTQRPDLFGAVVCGVPLLDMLRYHLYGTGKAWIPEYGSADDPQQFEVLRAYSPYHRIAPGTSYPPLLMLSVDSDDRVDPFHARKFVAALKAASSSGEPVLLHIETNAGHGGADLRRAEVEKATNLISFLLSELVN